MIFLWVLMSMTLLNKPLGNDLVFLHCIGDARPEIFPAEILTKRDWFANYSRAPAIANPSAERIELHPCITSGKCDSHPEILPAEILTRRELRSGNADWDDQNFALPRGARRMNT